MTIEQLGQRVLNIERMLRQVLKEVPDRPLRLSEKQVMAQYSLSKSRLKQLRLGYTLKGVRHDPVLFKWSAKANGRHIMYDAAELEEVFKQKTPLYG